MSIKDIQDNFAVYTFTDCYFRLRALWDQYSFTDQLPDEEMIAELRKVYTDFKRYIFSKESVVMKHEHNLSNMLEAVMQLQSKTSDKAETRAELLYNALRDEWLNQLHMAIVDTMNEEVEE